MFSTASKLAGLAAALVLLSGCALLDKWTDAVTNPEGTACVWYRAPALDEEGKAFFDAAEAAGTLPRNVVEFLDTVADNREKSTLFCEGSEGTDDHDDPPT